MTFSSFISLLVLMLSGTVTPGPNNALLSASGMNFGYKRSLPHMFGVGLGLSAMVFIIALGAGVLFCQFPAFRITLQITSVLLLLWLAYKIATAPVEKLASAKTEAKPWTFWQAFFFQWINPKAWVIAIAVTGPYAGGARPILSAALIGFAAILASCVSTNTWTGFGVAMARILSTPTRRRIFNYTLAALILISVLLLLGGDHAQVC